MELDLRALQMIVEEENSVETTRNILNKAVEFFSKHKDNRWKVERVFYDLRHSKFNFDDLDEKDIFLCDLDEFKIFDIPDEFKSYSLGLFSDERVCRYAYRLVYPVRDVKGNVMGLCGWDPEDLPKYLDSKTYGYNAKRNCLYGMEKLEEYYKSNKPVFIVEGIVCCNYLRSKGFQALALLGSSISKYVIEILKRFGNRLILIPDNDMAGLSVLKSSLYNLPNSRCYVSLVAKDIDDTRKKDDGIYELQLLSELSNIQNLFCFTNILSMVK